MKPATRDRILAAWDNLEESYPDKSTEWLLSMTADQAKVDYDVVVSAVTRHRFKEVKQ